MIIFFIFISYFAGANVDLILFVVFFFFKQKTAYEIGTGDWSSDVCSSDLFVLERDPQKVRNNSLVLP